MLGKRLISAAVIISGMILLLRLDFWLGTDAVWSMPGLVLAVLAILTAAMAGDELTAMFTSAASKVCLLYTSPSPRDQRGSRMPSSA